MYRILIGLGALILLVIVGAQLIFWSNLPKKLAIPIAERQLGLKVQVGSLSTGWFGHTTLTDVKLALPLADQSFLEIKKMKVSHTSVFGIIFGSGVEVSSVELDQPNLIVRQNDAGRWNLQEAADLGGKPTGGSSEQKSSPSVPKLPEVMINGARIVVIPKSGVQAKIENVSLHGRPEGRLFYTVEAQSPGHFKSEGRIVTGGDWSQDISLDVQQINDWVNPWIKQWPKSAMARLHWQGHFSNGAVTGRLTVEQSQYEQFSAKGVMSVVAGGAGVTARPVGLTIEGGSAPECKLVGGSIGFQDGVLSLDALQVSMSGGMARLDGEYRLGNQSANLEAVWEQIHFPSAASQSGRLEAELTYPWPNQPRLNVMLESSGKISAGRWDARMNMFAQGKGWDQMNCHVEFPRLAFNGTKPIDLHGLSADLLMRDQTINLDTLKLQGPGRVSGQGAIDLRNKIWWLWADGSVGVQPMTDDSQIRFSLNTWGDFTSATVQQAYLEMGRLQLTAQGDFHSGYSKPLNMDVYMEHLLGGGRLWSQLHLDGTISPVQFNLVGRLYGNQLQVNQRPIGDASVELTGVIDAEHAEVHSTELKLLDGKWRFDATYPEEEQSLRIVVSVDDLPLKQASALVTSLPVDGQFKGKWTIDLPQLKPKLMEMEGHFEADQFNSPGLVAQTVEGEMRIDDGRLAVGPVVLRKEEGSINASANLGLDEAGKIHAEVSATAWPVETNKGQLEVWANTKLDLNLKDKTAAGPLSFTATASLDDKPLGKLSLDSVLQGRVVNLKQIGGDIFGGSIQGQAVVDIDKPMLSRGQVGWSAIDNDQVAAVFPELEPLHGRFSGNIQFSPAEDSRALEPLRVTGTIRADGGHFRQLQIGGASFLMFVGITDQYSAFRAVLEHFDMSVGGGTVNLWARASQHQDRDLWAQANLNFTDLDLNQLVHTARSSAKTMPGKLSGWTTAVGDPLDVRKIYAEGGVRLTDSDLANVPGFAELYNALHLALGPQAPSGKGRASFRIEGQTFSLLDARYFNRGVEAFASGSSTNIWSGKQAGLDYVIVGTVRPLKNIDLPFMADMDAVLSAIQGALTSMRVTGTIEQPNATPMAFGDLGGDILGMILGETKSPQTTAGR
jgi:hypothetical protein